MSPDEAINAIRLTLLFGAILVGGILGWEALRWFDHVSKNPPAQDHEWCRLHNAPMTHCQRYHRKD